MKNVVFVSNFYNHHQSEFSNEMSKLCDYHFVSTEIMGNDRKKLGYQEENPDFLIDLANNSELLLEVKNLINNADYVIWGSAPIGLLNERIRADKIVFQYSERIFKNTRLKLLYPVIAYRYKKYFGKKNMYLLCSSAYAYSDYKKIGLYKEKAYNWGYFPQLKEYDINTLIENKKERTILWAGRLIGWKHPSYAIELAKRLKGEGYEFKLNIIGSGYLEDEVKHKIADNGLSKVVHFLGSMTPSHVREEMEKSEIFIFTSDFNEGWGAVLNEAMNSACAVVANVAIGSVPFLIEDNNNGMIYKNGNFDDFYSKVTFLLNNPNIRKEMSVNAYDTIYKKWNAKIAATRFFTLAEELNSTGKSSSYKSGICCSASLINNNYYKESIHG